jgi:serine/threonine protein phosphatase PrpC
LDPVEHDITFRRPIEWRSCGQTHVGVVRQLNEDALVDRPNAGLWAVADGLGGHHLGDQASRLLQDTLYQVPTPQRLSHFVDAVEQALLDCNDDILDYTAAMEQPSTMGSTIVALLIRGQVGMCLWAGDSRLYRLRNHQLVQLSRDHSHVQELVDMGMISQEEVEKHPRSNVITRAIGVEPDVIIDMTVFNTQIGDTFLLCSDGLFNCVSEAQISVMLADKDPEQITEQLIHTALQNGAPDNVTVVVIKGEPGKF